MSVCFLLVSKSSSLQQSTSKHSEREVDTSLPEIRSLVCRDTSNDKDQMQRRSVNEESLLVN